MEATQVAILVLGLLASGGIFWMVWRRRHTFDVDSINAALSDVLLAFEIARELVLGAEQLWEIGDLPKDDRFQRVWDAMDELFPGLDEDLLEMIIEGAVRGLKMIVPVVETIISGDIELVED